MNTFEQYAPEDAQEITLRLIDAAIALGFILSVNDGEVWTVKSSRDRQNIIDALATTDHDLLRVYDPRSDKAGNIMLIYQNGEDVISDYHCQPHIEQLCAGVMQAQVA